jgi:GntR family transcriptional regulator, transcriptional repressor for pyruvate dehydrogenase complex
MLTAVYICDPVRHENNSKTFLITRPQSLMQRNSIRTMGNRSNVSGFNKVYPFRALTKSRLFEDVADQIKEAVFKGAIKPGECLPSERELCSLFQVGRPTIREALRTLSVLGLIEVGRGQKGSVVKDYDISQYLKEIRKQLSYLIRADKNTLKELWEVRKYLEWGVARSAAENATEEDFKRVAQLIRKMEDCGKDIEGYYPLGTAFHQQLAAATRNKVFYMIWEMIHEVLLRGYIPLLKEMFPDGPEQLLKANKNLFEAIQSRDSQAIDRAVAIHAEDENVFLN